MDYITRLNFALKENTDNGGTNIFLTFTYDDDHVPHLVYKDQSCLCFSKDDIRRLISSIRKYYDKRGLKFQYFICGEYGEQTKRPHYHGTFLLPKEINPYQFSEKARKSWTYMYISEKDEFTNNGFMFPSKTDVRLGTMFIRNIDDANKYLSKYTCKDLYFYGIPLIKEVNEKFINKANRLNPDEKIKAIYRYFYNRMPHVYHSSGLGTKAILEYLDQNPSANEITDPFTGYKVSIPRSVIDKFSYEFVKSDRISPKTGKPILERYMTDKGLQRRVELLPKFISDKVLSYRTLLTHKSSDQLLRAAIFHYCYKYYTYNQLVNYHAFIGDLFTPFNYRLFFIMNLMNHRMTLSWLDKDSKSLIHFYSKLSLLESDQVDTYSDITFVKLDENYLESKLLERSKKEALLRAERQKINDSVKRIVNPNLDQQIGTEDNIYKPMHLSALVS